MRCPDFEHLMLESKERELLREERAALEKHLESCAQCAAFRDFWKDLRSGLPEAAGPALRAGLSESVRLRCHAELDSLSSARAGEEAEKRPAAAPWPILAALLLLTGLTMAFLIPTIEKFSQAQKVTIEMVLVVMVVLQNALMLLFAPVLLRRGRFAAFDFERSQ
jgi:hypothetical protein